MDTRSGTTLPRGTEPRQSDASMTANAVREKEPAGGAAASGSQAPSTSQSISDLVIRDHKLVKKLYEDYQRASSGEEKESIAHRIHNEIVQHTGKKEISVYPIVRKKLPNGDSLADRAAAQHQQMKEDLRRLHEMSPVKFPVQFDQSLAKIMSELTQHISEHESELLPALEKVCSRDELVEMGRKFNSATVTTLPHPWSITDLVIRDHKLVKKLYEDYQRASSGEEKESIAHRIINEIVQHSGKEEISMYPIMRKKLPNGDSLVDRAAVEHQQVTEDLYRLDQMSLAKFPAQFDQCLSKIMSELTQHIVEEEGELLPALEKVCSHDELVEMGRKFDSTTVTTRPHPWAPREGAAAAAAHAMSKPVDAVRDAIRGDASKEQARDVKEKDEIRSM